MKSLKNRHSFLSTKLNCDCYKIPQYQVGWKLTEIKKSDRGGGTELGLSDYDSVELGDVVSLKGRVYKERLVKERVVKERLVKERVVKERGLFILSTC